MRCNNSSVLGIFGEVSEHDRRALALLSLRLSVFLVMFMWTLDKLVNPAHAADVYERFYRAPGLGAMSLGAIAIAELVLIVGFVAGYRKRLTYGAVLAVHGVSTLSSYGQYLTPFDHLLFFAAWPMLAACLALYSLRDLDTMWVVS